MADELHIQSLFISSTFRDMQVERDLIRDKLLPKLNELSADYQKIIEIVDLRWGIDTSTIDNDYKAQEKILNVCLDEIDRCKPYIVVLLGDRYGWIPDMDMLRSIGETKSFDVTERKSVTALEIEYGALKSRHKPKAFFYFRTIENREDIPEDLQKDYIGSGEERERLERLKEEIRHAFPQGIREYSVVWNKDKKEVEGLEGFEEELCSDILKAIREDLSHQVLSMSWQEKEINTQARVLFQKNHDFVGRENILQELNEYLFSYVIFSYVLLKGVSGSGKSSLFAHFVTTLQAEKDIVVFPFLCGTTGASSNLMTLLQVLIYQVSLYLGVEAVDEFRDVSEAGDELFRLLYLLPKDRKVILAVDGLDELARSDAVNRMTWLLVNRLPDHVKFFGTIVDGPEIEVIEAAGGKVMKLSALQDGDVDQIVEAFQKSSHKTLSPNVIEAIKSKKRKDGSLASHSPLYLNLVLQDLKMIDRYEFAEIERISDNRKEALDQFMLGRISSSDGSIREEYVSAIKRCEKLIGREFVTACLGLMAVSRFGLTEGILESCFALLDLKWDSAGFAWLRQILAPHFARSEYGEWDFNHRILRSTIELALMSKEERKSLNRVIMKTLEGMDAANDIVVRDLVYHYCRADEYEAITKYVADKQMAQDRRNVKYAFEAFLYMLNNVAPQYKEQRLNYVVNLLDFTKTLDMEEKLYLLHAYNTYLGGIIRPNISVQHSKAFYRKLIDFAVELNGNIRRIAYKAFIIDTFLFTAEFFIQEGYLEEAQWVFERFESIKLKYLDLFRNFSFENAEFVGGILKGQIAMTNKELAFALVNKEMQRADLILKKAKGNLMLLRTYRLLFSGKWVLFYWAVYERAVNFLLKKIDREEYKPLSIYPLYSALYFFNREWNYMAVLEVLSREFDLHLGKKDQKKLDIIHKRRTELVAKENRLFKRFEEAAALQEFENSMQDSENADGDEKQLMNAMMGVVESIRSYHQLIASDEGILDEKLLLLEQEQNPGANLEKHIALAEFSEKQYKKYGGILYTGNYAVRLEKVAGIYFIMERYEDAFDWYCKAVDVLYTMSKYERYKDMEALARCCEQAGRAALLWEAEYSTEAAEEQFKVVLSLRQLMKRNYPDIDIDNDLAIAYYNLALAQNEQEKYDLSFRHFTMAADLGYAPAVNYLGIMYEYGEGVDVDIGKAKEYYEKAYKQGDDNGRIILERLARGEASGDGSELA